MHQRRETDNAFDYKRQRGGRPHNVQGNQNVQTVCSSIRSQACSQGQYNPRHEETANYISIRIRFFDDIAREGAAQGVRQFVLPAAGMDARAYRLPWPDGITFYELDHPELLDIKGRLLTGQSLAPKCTRVLIGTDLRQDWARLLVDSGFYYLDEPAVHHVLKEVSGLATPRSLLVTDLVSQSLLSSPWMQRALKAMEERGMGWRFGTDDPVGLFAHHGWEADLKHPAEEGAKYNPQRFPNKSEQSMMPLFKDLSS